MTITPSPQASFDAITGEDQRPVVDRKNLFRQLKNILPASDILTSAEDLHPYECDGLSAYRVLPMMVVLPTTLPQLQKIVTLCHKLNIAIIARGAGTGLSAGALPSDGALLISLARFNQILDIDLEKRLARVQPGVRNLAISQAVDQHGLFYAPDPSSQIACSIGGNVAENSGGVHCLKYGLTVHNVQSLKILTIDGDIIEIGHDALDTAGYDLLALMHGSEGMLGIIVEVSVKLLPKPQSTQVLLIAFDNVADAGNAVTAIISNGIIPAGLEMMDTLAIQAAEDFIHADYPTNAAALLLCELDGSEAETEHMLSRIQTILEKFNVIEIRTAKDAAERMKLWAGRKAAFPAVGRLSPDYYCMDGTIPRARLADVLTRISALSAEYKLRVANVFHAGDGNLHPLILYDANIEGELELTEEFGGKILEYCVEVGGSITGEHGVGLEKINQMCIQFQPMELSQFHAVKAAFDPKGLLNPGKAVPTLHRCAEFGAMHVHHGKLKHPDIPRF